MIEFKAKRNIITRYLAFVVSLLMVLSNISSGFAFFENDNNSTRVIFNNSKDGSVQSVTVSNDLIKLPDTGADDDVDLTDPHYYPAETVKIDDKSDTSIDEEPEDVSPTLVYQTITDEIGNVTVKGSLPEGSTVTARPLTDNEIEALKLVGVSVVFAYDITIFVDGEEYQPKIPVQVSVKEDNIPEDISVSHFETKVNGRLVSTEVETTVDDNEAVFDVNSFSIYVGYTVDFHYDNANFSIRGETFILLSNLLLNVGYGLNKAKDAVSVVFSNTNYITVNKIANDWRLVSIAPFDTAETLTVSFVNGDVLEISVTDAAGVPEGLDVTDAGFLDMYLKVFGEAYDGLSNTAFVYVADNRFNGDTTYAIGDEILPATSLAEAMSQYTTKNRILMLRDGYTYTPNGNSYTGYTGADVSAAWTLGASTAPLMLIGWGGYLTMSDDWYFVSNTGFYNVEIKLDYAASENHEIYCCGNTCVFGAVGASVGSGALQITRTNTSVYYPTLFGGSDIATTYAAANLYVNSGTFDRIYGGGAHGNNISGTATTVVDFSSSALTITSDNGLTSLYSGDTENIIGGGAHHLSNIASPSDPGFGTVAYTSLSVFNRTSSGTFLIAPNGGRVTESSECIVVGCSGSGMTIQRASGEMKDLDFVLSDSTFYLQLFSQHYYSYIVADSTVNVSISNCLVTGFQAIGSSAQHDLLEANSNPRITLLYFYADHTNFSGNFRAEGHNTYFSLALEHHYTFNSCAFLTSNTNRIYFGGGCANGEYYSFVNCYQRIYLYNEGVPNQGIGNNTEIHINLLNYSDYYRSYYLTRTHLSFSNCSDVTMVNSDRILGYLEVVGDSTVFHCPDLTVNHIRGTSGTIEVGDDNTLSIPADGIDAGTRLYFTSPSVMTGMSTISYAGTGDSDYFTITPPDGCYPLSEMGTASFWYISADPIPENFDSFIYLDQTSGSDSNDGSRSHPVQSLDRAFALLQNADVGNGIVERNTIVVVSPYTVPYGSYASPVQIGTTCSSGLAFIPELTYTDGFHVFDSTGYLNFTHTNRDSYVTVNCNLTIHDLHFSSAAGESLSNRTLIAVNGHKVLLGANVVNHNSVCIFGNSLTGNVAKVDLEVNSGYWESIGLFSSSAGSSVGDVSRDGGWVIDPDEDPVVRIVTGPNASFTGACSSTSSINYRLKIYGNALFNYGGSSAVGSVTNWSFSGNYDCYGDFVLNFQGYYPGNLGYTTIDGNYRGRFICDFSAATFVKMRYNLTYKGTYHDVADINLGVITYNYTTVETVFDGITAYKDFTVSSAGTGSTYKLTINNLSVGTLGGVTGHYYFNWAGRIIQLDETQSTAGIVDFKFKNTDETFVTRQEFSIPYITTSGNVSYIIDVNVLFNVPKKTSLNSYNLTLSENAELASYKTVVVKNDLTIRDGALLTSYSFLTVDGDLIGETNSTNCGKIDIQGTPTGGTQDSYIMGNVNGYVLLNTSFPVFQPETMYYGGITSGGFVPCDYVGFDPATLSGSGGNFTFFSLIDRTYVFVRDTGDDLHSGVDYDHAVATLKQAYSFVKPGGVIVVCGETSVSQWPSNSAKAVTLTSYYKSGSGFSPDYRKAPYNAKLRITTYNLGSQFKADTCFGLVTLQGWGTNHFVAAGNRLVMGLSPEDLAEYPEGTANFFNSVGTLRLSGSDTTGVFPCYLEINSGTYGNVFAVNASSNYAGDPSQYTATVKMTGGTIGGLCECQDDRDPYGGRINYILSGGRVTNFTADNSVTTTAVGTRSVYLEISGTFECTNLIGVATSSGNRTGDGFTMYVHDLETPLTGIRLGNVESGAYLAPLTVTITNATVNIVRGGVNSTSGYQYRSGNVNINLNSNARIVDLYAGSQGSYDSLNNIYINVLSPSAMIDNYYAHGYSTSHRARNVEVRVNTGGYLPSGALDWITEPVDALVIGNVSDSSAYIPAAVAPNIADLRIAGGSAAYIEKNAAFSGDYTASDDSSDPSYLLLYNASIVLFAGNGTGYTSLLSGAPDSGGASTVAGMTYYADSTPFVNGVQIFGTNSTPSATAFTETTLGTASYGEGRWYFSDNTDTVTRNMIYVSGAGSDENINSSSGTYGQPLRTLAGAYVAAQKRYAAIAALTEGTGVGEVDFMTEVGTTKADYLAQGISIVLKDDIDLGNFGALSETWTVPVVTIRSESLKKDIVFNTYYQYTIPVATVLQNVNLEDSTAVNVTPAVYGNGNYLVISDTVTTSDGSSFTAYGGSYSTAVSSTDLTVYGGHWTAIFGGGNYGTVTGDVSLTVGYNAETEAAGTNEGVFGGGYNGTATVGGDVVLKINEGLFGKVLGGGYNPPVSGTVIIKFNSGSIEKLYGGGMFATATTGSIEVNIGDRTLSSSDERDTFLLDTLRGAGMQAGLASAGDAVVVNMFRDAVIGQDGSTGDFCAGGYSGTVPQTTLVIDGARVIGDVHGGGAGTEDSTAYGVVGDTFVVILSGDITGNVFGGGLNALVTGTATVTVTGGNISGQIFGGGDAASVGASSVTVDHSGGTLTGNIYGGSYNITNSDKQIQNDSQVNLKGGTSSGSVFAASSISGDISGTAHIFIGSGDSFTADSIYGGGELASSSYTLTDIRGSFKGDVYGGGKGAYDPDFDVLTDAVVFYRTDVYISGTVTGNIYGGGELASVGDGLGTGTTEVDLTTGATVIGNIYGGGKGLSGHDFAAVGSTLVQIGNNEYATSISVVSSDHDETSARGIVFGGGEIAPVIGNTYVNVYAGNVSNVFGGNDVMGDIGGTTNVAVYGGTVAQVYGSGRDAALNETGNKANVTISAGTVTEAYGGGYGATAVTLETELTVSGGTVSTTYGGGNAAPTSTAATTIYGGTVTNVYGGGNAATVTAAAEVTINSSNSITNVFLGNNQASMAIQPSVTLTDATVTNMYLGGNAGIMTGSGKMSYTFDYPNADITNLYAGCNNTSDSTPTRDVSLTLASGSYTTVYGGNNTSGRMNDTDIIVDESTVSGHDLSIDTVYGGGNQATSTNTCVTLKNGDVTTVYGGGNQATSTNTCVTLKNGDVTTVYGGGNAATVTDSVKIIANGAASADVNVGSLFCGNNAADMAIVPELDFGHTASATGNITIGEFYGGGNLGRMTNSSGLSYSFPSTGTTINTIYGGCNQANVVGPITLDLTGAQVGTVYGGCNTSGNVPTTSVNINGSNVTGKVFGGGCGASTVVTTANVNAKKGTVSGNIYGGSGYGNVHTSNVSVNDHGAGGIIVINGNVFGGGFGDTSNVRYTNVTVNTTLGIGGAGCDLVVSEVLEDALSGKLGATVSGDLSSRSVINGNVFGGADMGTVGRGAIDTGTNTAAVSQKGTTSVSITNGHIIGSVFGGGNGEPTGSVPYTVYMGTVFGNSTVNVTGGYIEHNIYGCGNQSRTYAASGSPRAALVNITETSSTPIVIGGQIFGGGNKGSGTSVNASVHTVVGNTEVNVTGRADNTGSTEIYIINGGIYGDGNLCLVNGNRTVNITNFNGGTSAADQSLLKDVKSLQRADVINMDATRIYLDGDLDLVNSEGDSTEYSINRVAQLNMSNSSTLSLYSIVNLLGGITSDEQTTRQFLNTGNNGVNSYTARGGTVPSGRIVDDSERTAFINAFNSRSAGHSYNVIAVANGQYLEIKKSSSAYGDVKGLFILQLNRPNQGEGGGFVYANIGGLSALDTGSTGEFICATLNGTGGSSYMGVSEDVGGYQGSDYTYYYWYLSGSQVDYTVYLNGYIGTSETEFTTEIQLTQMTQGYHYVLKSVSGNVPHTGADLPENKFDTTRLVDNWDDPDYVNQHKYAVELKMLRTYNNGSGLVTDTVSLGFLSWDASTSQFKIRKGSNYYTGIGEGTDLIANTLYTIPNTEATTALAIRFVLYKGYDVNVEIKDVINYVNFVIYESTYSVLAATEANRVNITLHTYITRIIPSQSVFMAASKQYAGVTLDAPVDITHNSSYTLQYITNFVPSSYSGISEVLTARVNKIYLYNTAGLSVTITDDGLGNITVVNATYGDTHTVVKDGSDYYLDSVSPSNRLLIKTTEVLTSTFPAGTTIALVARIDDYAPTFWYYYCTTEVSEIPLSSFKMMNTSFGGTENYSLVAASGGNITYSTGFRISENLTFIIDFRNVTFGALPHSMRTQLLHSYTVSTFTVDVMDYVKQTTVESVTVYSRENPAVSSLLTVSTGTGIDSLTQSLDNASYTPNQTVSGTLTLSAATTPRNTEYDENNFAVKLTLLDSSSNEIAFPLGTEIVFDGNILSLSDDNDFVIIPVNGYGTYVYTVTASLGAGFPAGSYSLKADLYSAPLSGFYNHIDTTCTVTTAFAVTSASTSAILIEPVTDSAERILYPTSVDRNVLNLTVTVTGGTPSVSLYVLTNKGYEAVLMTYVFTGANATVSGSVWSYSLNSGASAGIYRLEFRIGDKVEYVDFIVR